jgi:short-subunit dehydrogenase
VYTYSLKNKVILITGGSGGIGSAIVNKLSSSCANIVSVYHKKLPADQANENVFWIKADLTIPNEWELILSYTIKKFGRIDALINCTGNFEPGDFSSLEENEVGKMIELNLTSVIIGIHKTLKIFKEEDSGHIINIGSLGGIVPMPYSSVYCATKFALRGFTFSLAEELRETGIKISLITPGAVITGMLDYEAQNSNTAIAFISKPISPLKVANEVLKVIRKPQSEVIIPQSVSIASRLLTFSPKIFSTLYGLLHRIGLFRKRNYLNRYCNFTLARGLSK